MSHRTVRSERLCRECVHVLESLERRSLLSSSILPDARDLWAVPSGRPIDAVVSGDFDADGDQDLVAAAGRRLAFLENRGFGAFAPARVRTLANRVNLLAAAPLDGRPGDDLLAVAAGVGDSVDRSLIRALYFDHVDRTFEFGAATTASGVVSQVLTGDVLDGPRHEVFIVASGRIAVFKLPTRSTFAPLRTPVNISVTELVAGIALRAGADTGGAPTLVVATNSASITTSPLDQFARLHETRQLALRLTADPRIPFGVSIPFYEYGPQSRIHSVLTGNLDGDAVDEIVVTGLLPFAPIAVPPAALTPGPRLQAQYFNLDTPSLPRGEAISPITIYTPNLINTMALPTLMARSIGELNADGAPDVLVELRVTGLEGESNIRAVGLYQRSPVSFDAQTHSTEVAIPGSFPSGAAVLGAALTGRGAGLSVITLRTPAVTTNPWATLAVRRNTIANKRPIVQDVSVIGPFETDPMRYFAASVFEADTPRGGVIQRVELFIDHDADGVLDPTDTLRGEFTQTPPPQGALTPQPGQSVWYIPVPLFAVPPQTFYYLVRAFDDQGAVSSMFALSVFQDRDLSMGGGG